MEKWTSKNLTGICGVYIIRNKVNGKFYIGSSNDIWRRWCEHKWGLKNNKHGNKHLQRAYNKYGEENFEYDVLEFCDEEVQFDKEQEYIDKYWGDHMFYNENKVASKPPNNKGKKNASTSKAIYVYNENGLLGHFQSISECCQWLLDNKYATNEGKNKIRYVGKQIRLSILNNELYNDLIFSYEKLTKDKIKKIYDNPSKELKKINKEEKVKSRRKKQESFNNKEIYIYDSNYNLILYHEDAVLGVKKFMATHQIVRCRINATKKNNGRFIVNFIDKHIKKHKPCCGFIFSYEPLEKEKQAS